MTSARPVKSLYDLPPGYRPVIASVKIPESTEVWFQGEPPSPGEYHSSYFKDDTMFRYWDGVLWSRPYIIANSGPYRRKQREIKTRSDYVSNLFWRPATALELAALNVVGKGRKK